MILTPRTPALAYPIGSRDTRILVDVPAPIPKQSTGELVEYLRANVVPYMPEGIAVRRAMC